MESFNKKVKDAASAVSKGATELAEKVELEKRLSDAKKSVDGFAKEHALDVKAKEVSHKAAEFAKEHELDKKFEEVKVSAETFVKEKELDVKMEDAKKSVEEFAKENQLFSDVKSGVEEGKIAAEKEMTAVKDEKEEEKEKEKLINKEENKEEKTEDDITERKSDTESEAEAAETGTGASTDDATEETTEDDTTKKEYPGDITLEHLKNEVESIAHKIETSTRNLVEREEVQKVLTPLMAKLAVAKAKFVEMSEKRKKKSKGGDDEEGGEEGVEVELGKENNVEETEEAAATEDDKDRSSATTPTGDDESKEKLPSQFAEEEMLSRAKKAVKAALEKAEAIVKKTADKFGIHVFNNTEDGSVELKLDDTDSGKPADIADSATTEEEVKEEPAKVESV